MEKLKISIGRNPQCDFPINNPEQHRTVSGYHATLSETERPDMFLFEDHSTNGTYINGTLLHNASSMVRFNDQIILGKTYNLPIQDIAMRYFSHSRATVKKPAGQRIPSGTLYTPTSMIPEEDTLKQVMEPQIKEPQVPEQQTSFEDSIPPTNSTPKMDMKKLYGIVIIGSIILGVIIGLIIILV